MRILEEARALGRRGAPGDRLHLPQRARPAGGAGATHPPRPLARRGAGRLHYHKLYFDALLAARSLLASLGRVDVVHAHLHDGALIGYFVSRLRRVPLVFDYQGSLAREMVDHQFLRRESPLYRPVAWLERTIDGLADVILTSSTNAAEAILAGRGGGGGGLKLPKGGGAEGALRWRPSWTGWTYTPSTGPTRRRWPPCAPATASAAAPGGGLRGAAGRVPGVGDLIYAARRVIERRPRPTS